MAPPHIFNYGHPYPVIDAALCFVVLADSSAQHLMHDLDREEYLLWKPNRHRQQVVHKEANCFLPLVLARVLVEDVRNVKHDQPDKLNVLLLLDPSLHGWLLDHPLEEWELNANGGEELDQVPNLLQVNLNQV